MKLSICTDVMADLAFTDMLDKCVALGVEGIEMTGGGWSKGPHFRADRLLADRSALKAALKEIEARGLAIAALNCSANPLDPGPMGERHRKEMEETVRLAGEIGVTTIVTMSGLPAAAPGDSVPNWLVYTKSWPDEMPERDRYQWEDCAFPFWEKMVILGAALAAQQPRETVAALGNQLGDAGLQHLPDPGGGLDRERVGAGEERDVGDAGERAVAFLARWRTSAARLQCPPEI